MQKYHYFPMTLFAVAIISGCSSVPQNQSLAEAHSSYNDARTSPDISNLAAVELKDASDTLNKADNALNNDEKFLPIQIKSGNPKGWHYDSFYNLDSELCGHSGTDRTDGGVKSRGKQCN